MAVRKTLFVVSTVTALVTRSNLPKNVTVTITSAFYCVLCQASKKPSPSR